MALAGSGDGFRLCRRRTIIRSMGADRARGDLPLILFGFLALLLFLWLAVRTNDSHARRPSKDGTPLTQQQQELAARDHIFARRWRSSSE